jgi:rubrerythrin
MTVFRCRICGAPYLGSAPPTHCPACGAHQKHLIDAAKYQPPAIVELTQKSRENLQRALEMETKNSNFYRGVYKVADNEKDKAQFQALARIEAEHALVIARILGLPRPEEIAETGDCSPSHKENLKELIRREERAQHLYRRFFEEAKEERVREVLQALIETEADHLRLIQ